MQALSIINSSFSVLCRVWVLLFFTWIGLRALFIGGIINIAFVNCSLFITAIVVNNNAEVYSTDAGAVLLLPCIWLFSPDISHFESDWKSSNDKMMQLHSQHRCSGVLMFNVHSCELTCMFPNKAGCRSTVCQIKDR